MSQKEDVIYCRFSSELQRIESNADQERRCRDHLDRMGIPHNRFRVISDEAISGQCDDRPGFNQLKDLIEAERLGTLVVSEQSRLSRGDNVTGLIKGIVFHGGRFISLTEGIDTARKGWKLLVGISEIHHARSNEDTAERVRGGQEGRVADGNGSAGDFPYGYRSEFVDPAAAAAYCGRGPKPKKVVVIDDAKAAVVRDIFARFVGGLSISAIVVWLNGIRGSIPRIGNRKGKGVWHHQHVRCILSNPKYVGDWSYGNTTTVYDGDGNGKQVPARPDQRVTRVDRPSLRLIDQATWDAAQAKLAELLKIYGQKPDGAKRGTSTYYKLLYASRPIDGKVLCGYCLAHGHENAPLHIGGSKKRKWMGCPRHKAGTCPVAVRVPYAKAEAAVVGVVTDVLRNHPAFVASAVAQMRAAIVRMAKRTPEEVAAERASLSEIERKIRNVIGELEDGKGSAALRERLAQLETDKVRTEARVSELAEAQVAVAKMPDDRWVRGRLADLGSLIRDGAPEGTQLLRSMIGRIVAEEVKIPGKKRGYVRIRFRVDGWAALIRLLSGKLPASVLNAFSPADVTAGTSDEFVVDLGAPTDMDSWGPKIVEWRKQKVKWHEIARRTGLKIANAYVVWRRCKDHRDAA